MPPPRYASSTGSTMFRRPGPVLRVLLILLVVLGFVVSTIQEYGEDSFALLAKLVTCSPALVVHGWVWTLLTSGFVSIPVQLLHTLAVVFGLYIFSVDLEQRWGGRRYLGFVLGSIVAGNVVTVLLSFLPLSWSLLHPSYVCGTGAALAAVAAAWSLTNAETEVRLFFILPVKGKLIFWITVAFAVLGVVYPSQFPSLEGAFAPFAGILLGMYVAGGRAGAPSPLRAFYLRLKLAMLRRKTGGAHLASYGLRPAAGPSGKRISRSGGPALHVVYGGLDDDGKPKDKRTLN